MMNIAWHGSYVKYLEDGREDFGNHFGIGYMNIYRAGYKAPVVDLKIEYKKSVGIGDRIWIETRYVHTEAAKIYFDYIIYNEAGEIVVTAYTIQVFLDRDDRLVLQNPEFYTEWKKRWNIL
jgi:acyl-CoA thioester hydrolase